MYIQSISLTQPQQYKANFKNKPNKIRNFKEHSYNPIAYRDYNISFGDRLFRTPENFYEQDFNRENMPQTMASYLFADYDDRKHIPPAQMMKIVFNDINNAKSLEEVKELYPNEPLFAKLHSMDNKKYREGILAEIRYLKEPDKSLFKNGKDDLGLYILKKIYLEGKTLKEINKDFKKDVSVVYAGISDINYRDLSNFGIKFPNNSFWHSFYVTREDFPYVSVKRKDAEFHAQGAKKELTLADINKGNFQDKRPPKYKPKDHEIKDITGAILEDFGDKEKTNKNLKRKLKSDDPKLTFIQRYMGEIMSISLDRVHASDEMRTFFEDYDNLDKSARTRMKKYWETTPEMKALQGLVMSDTIKLFFESYGADGNNEIFKDLLDYARSIKPEREQNLAKHNENQKMYEEIFSNYEPKASETEEFNAETTKIIEEVKGLHDDIKKLNEYIKEHQYCYDFGGQKVNLQTSIEDMIGEYNLTKMDDYLPVSYINKYTKFLKEHPNTSNKFLLSVILYDTENNATDELLKELYPSEECSEMLYKMQLEYMKKHLPESRAAQQALVKVVSKRATKEQIKELPIIYNIFPLQTPGFKKYIHVDMTGAKDDLAKYYSIYKKPITTSEAQKITLKITELLKNYDSSNSHLRIAGDEESQEVQKTIELSKVFKNPRKSSQKFFKENMVKLLTQIYGGSARALLDPDLPECAKVATMEDIILSFTYNFPNLYKSLVMFNDANI